MRRFYLVLLLSLATVLPLVGRVEPSPAQRELQSIVTRQQRLMAEAVQQEDGPTFDAENFRTKMQEIAFDYESYIAKYPDTAAGYAAYGYFLSKIDPLPKQTVVMLLKANQLDPNLPLVKNQLGKYLAEEGKPLEAVNYFIAATRLDPEEPLYHYQLGQLLAAARDDFLKSGNWTRPQLDKAMHEAFRRAAELAPQRIEFTYRYAESFYDLETPDWEGALKQWQALEEKAKPGVEQQVIRLHRANVLIQQGKPTEAQALLATVTEPTLTKQKEKLVAQLPASSAK